MALELVATGRRQATLREYDPEPPGPDEVRIDSSFSAFKHGTGLRGFRADTRDYTAPFDWELRLHREGDAEPPDYPLPLGNLTVGTVAEAGGDVALDAGDRVYGHLPIRETHTVAADRVEPVPEGMSAEAVACSDPGRVGVHLVRVAGVGVGDAVAVVGAGAIGQMTAQLARRQGAGTVIVSEPIDRRRRLAGEHGADLLIDPTAEDAGERVKTAVEAGDEPGVDVALETSGAYAGLHDAVRATAFGGTVAACGYYADDPAGLRLEGEWHRNALDLRSVRPPSEPLREHPRWTLSRLEDIAFDLLAAGTLSAEGLLDPVVPLERAAERLELIDQRPEESVKLGVRYD